MSKSKDSDEIYNLLLKGLKIALSKPEPDVKSMTLALNFCKQFGLDKTIKATKQDAKEFIENLPFK